jgi:7-carboxy-7-deazaguanine synthase
MKYKIANLFTSIIGEGRFAGTPASFIRLAGCNVNCDFCDTEYIANEELTENELVSWAKGNNLKHVVITGGEPLMQDLTPLALLMPMAHLETNGTYPIPFACRSWWIAVSPKTHNCLITTLVEADEIKFLYGTYNWDIIIKEYKDVGRGIKWITPIVIGDRDRYKLNVEKAIKYCLDNPEFNYCCQIHKYLNIK